MRVNLDFQVRLRFMSCQMKILPLCICSYLRGEIFSQLSQQPLTFSQAFFNRQAVSVQRKHQNCLEDPQFKRQLDQLILGLCDNNPIFSTSRGVINRMCSSAGEREEGVLEVCQVSGCEGGRWQS